MSLPDPARWKRLSPLLDELLDLPSAARADRLRVLQAQDEALAAELALLVYASEQAKGAQFLTGHAGLGPVDSLPSSSLEGQRIGAYTLIAPLGQGGTGSVWRARRDDGRFEGEVAIKLLHLSLLGQSGALRFHREGAILARLGHPHIARLLDAGINEAGQPYLVLELVDGERIDRHCDLHRLTIEQRLSLFADVLSAVAHAHSHLVIHRDIKPNNILVGKDGHVKLLDFGIAKLLEDEGQAAESSSITQSGGRVLTPEYAAPEQLRGEPVTTATDVYALGVLLYQLLAGRHPTSPPQATAPQVMRATLGVEPAPLSNAWKSAGYSTALTTLAAQRNTLPAPLARKLRGDLENIVARALRKQPSERYATVPSLADDLRRYLHHEPVSVRADSLAYRTTKFLRRHRGAVAAAVLTGFAVVAGLAGTVTQARRAEQQAMRADQQAQLARRERDRALRDLTLAEASDEFLRFVLSDSAGRPVTMPDLLARSERLLDQQFADDAVLRAQLQLVIVDLYGEVLDFDKAEALLQRARTAAQGAGAADLTAQIDCKLAGLYDAVGRNVDTAPLYADAIARLKAQPEPDHAALGDCLNSRSIHHRDRGDGIASLADAQAAVAQLGTPRPGQRAGAAGFRASLAAAYSLVGQPARAIEIYERELGELERMGRGRTSGALTEMNNLGVLLLRAGQVGRAAVVFQHALDLATGDDAVSRQLLGTNYARALLELGETQEAMRVFEPALASAARSNNHRAYGNTLLSAAPAWCEAGQFKRCAALLADARSLLQPLLPPQHSAFGTLELIDGKLALAQGDAPTARKKLLHAVGLFDAATDRNALRIRALSLLARSEQQQGDAKAAVEHAAAAVAAAREATQAFGSTAWLGEALLAFAGVQRTQGDTASADAASKEALAQLRASLGETAPATLRARAALHGL